MRALTLFCANPAGFGRALRRALWTDEALALLPGAYGWNDGGCLILADALRLLLGDSARLTAVVGRGCVQHWVVTVDVAGQPVHADANGVARTAAVLRRWRRDEMVHGAHLVLGHDVTVRSDIPRDAAASLRVASYLRTFVGQATAGMDLRRWPGPRVQHVVQVFRQGTAEQVREGMRWYEAAHEIAAGLDPGDPRRAAGVLAALSPVTPWSRSVAMARRAYADGRATGTFSRSCRDADAIMAGADPLEVLHGPKVRAFFTLIADPADPAAVCVDRHGIDVAVRQRLLPAQRALWFPVQKQAHYEVFADCYRQAAARLRARPAQVQAVTWVIWRENNRTTAKSV